jgi:hypothetical protein
MAALQNVQYPNLPAPEREQGEYVGGPREDPYDGPAAPQPLTEYNPDGQIPGVPVTSPNL